MILQQLLNLVWVKEELAHVLGMYGTIIFWITSVILIFKYSDGNVAPSYLTSFGMLELL